MIPQRNPQGCSQEEFHLGPSQTQQSLVWLLVWYAPGPVLEGHFETEHSLVQVVVRTLKANGFWVHPQNAWGLAQPEK